MTEKSGTWCDFNSSLPIEYHDKHWSVPLSTKRELSELLIFEEVQTGLSWLSILNKQQNFRYDQW